MNPVTSVPKQIWVRNVKYHQSLNCQFLDTCRILVFPQSHLVMHVLFSLSAVDCSSYQTSVPSNINLLCTQGFTYTSNTGRPDLFALAKEVDPWMISRFLLMGYLIQAFLLKLSSKESLGKSQHNNPNALPPSVSFLLQIFKCSGEMLELMLSWKYHYF